MLMNWEIPVVPTAILLKMTESMQFFSKSLQNINQIIRTFLWRGKATIEYLKTILKNKNVGGFA